MALKKVPTIRTRKSTVRKIVDVLIPDSEPIPTPQVVVNLLSAIVERLDYIIENSTVVRPKKQKVK